MQNPIPQTFHYCLGCITDHKPINFKKQIAQLVIAILILVCSPAIIGFFNGNSLANIRANSPYSKTSEKVFYETGKVIKINNEKIEEDGMGGSKVLTQNVQIQLENYQNGKVIKNAYQTDTVDNKQKLNLGDQLVIRREPKVFDYNKDGNSEIFTIQDKFRYNNIVWIFVIFVVLILVLTGIRGMSALIGMFFSFVIISQVLIPGIISGANLTVLTFFTGLLILGVTMFIGHGFTKKTTIALVAGVFVITLATFLSSWVVDFSLLTGYGTEDAFHLKGSGVTNTINLRGLLISGIIIGAIGIMDDVTIAQAVAIEEISKANTRMTRLELFWRGMIIGQDHIISLINTLILAYVGTALPLLLSLTVYNFSPFWVIVNDQVVAEEIIRSVVGSICILMAIPVTNILAAYFSKQNKSFNKPTFSIVDEITNSKL
jgi:uncharacterized membrane protein